MKTIVNVALAAFLLSAGVTAARLIPGRVAGASPMALAALDAGAPVITATNPDLMPPDMEAPPTPDGPALGAIAGVQADPTTDPSGVLKWALDLVEKHEWGKLAALLVAAAVFALRRYRDKFGFLQRWYGDFALHLLVALAGGLAHHALVKTVGDSAPWMSWRLVLTGVLLAGISYLGTHAATWARAALAPAKASR